MVVLTIFLLIVGLLLIIKGGDWFVEAASWMAERSGIPKLVVGATVVALATTLPEIIVSVMAAVQGQTDMAIGNAVGSVTANLGLIMGIGMVFMPSKAKIAMGEYVGKFVLMIVAAVMVVIGGALGGVPLPLAVILLVLVAVFFADNLRLAFMMNKANKRKAKKVSMKARELVLKLLEFVAGAAGIVLGAELLVQNGTTLAETMGVSERIISVTIIAIGTSLPELVTMITAIVKHEGALGFGNILGACIIDLALILPLCGVISGQTLGIKGSSAVIDLPACLIVAAVAVIPTLITKKFQRWQGVTMIALYLTYLVITCVM